MAVQPATFLRRTLFLFLMLVIAWALACGGGSGTGGTGGGGGFGSGGTTPTFVREVHFATDSASAPGVPFNSSSLPINVTGSNTLLIAAWHAESGPGATWTVDDNGTPGTEIVNTDGYSGGSGNHLFRIYYWLHPQSGMHTVSVNSSYTGANELAFAVVLFNNVAQTSPVGTPALDVSATPRTGESEPVTTVSNDLVLHVIADGLFTRGTLSTGETSISVANDGFHTQDGDASLWFATKAPTSTSTTVSSSGWGTRVINGAGIAIHGTT
jgi:hypothetical protein